MLKQITSYPLNGKLNNKICEMRYIEEGVVRVIEGDMVTLNLFIQQNSNIVITYIGSPKISCKLYEKKTGKFSLI